MIDDANGYMLQNLGKWKEPTMARRSIEDRMEKSGDAEFSKGLGAWVRRELPGFLTRDDDKALFADLLAAPHAPATPAALPASQKTDA
jgi:hypothetical protein